MLPRRGCQEECLLADYDTKDLEYVFESDWIKGKKHMLKPRKKYRDNFREDGITEKEKLFPLRLCVWVLQIANKMD